MPHPSYGVLAPALCLEPPSRMDALLMLADRLRQIISAELKLVYVQFAFTPRAMPIHESQWEGLGFTLVDFKLPHLSLHTCEIAKISALAF